MMDFTCANIRREWNWVWKHGTHIGSPQLGTSLGILANENKLRLNFRNIVCVKRHLQMKETRRAEKVITRQHTVRAVQSTDLLRTITFILLYRFLPSSNFIFSERLWFSMWDLVPLLRTEFFATAAVGKLLFFKSQYRQRAFTCRWSASSAMLGLAWCSCSFPLKQSIFLF